MIDAIKYMIVGALLVLLVALIAYLLAYFNIHLPWPPITPTPSL